jgi:hypothetical protein
MKNYGFFEPVDDTTRLGKLSNTAFRKMNMMRGFSAPQVFVREGDELYKYQPDTTFLFYRFCLTELYFHAVVKELHEWKAKAEEYAGEFSCSWKYYAAAKRLDRIRDYGGDEEDYNPDGSIRAADDKELANYSIVSDLIHEGWKDVFIQTTPNDLMFIAVATYTESGIDAAEAFQKITGGEKLKTYRIENDQMIENDWADDILRKAEDKKNAGLIIDSLFGVFVEINNLIASVQALSKTDDNRFFFRQLPDRIQNIFDLKVKSVAISEAIVK